MTGDYAVAESILSDDSLMETPHRIAKMYKADEIFAGLDANFPKITLIEK